MRVHHFNNFLAEISPAINLDHDLMITSCDLLNFGRQYRKATPFDLNCIWQVYQCACMCVCACVCVCVRVWVLVMRNGLLDCLCLFSARAEAMDFVSNGDGASGCRCSWSADSTI